MLNCEVCKKPIKDNETVGSTFTIPSYPNNYWTLKNFTDKLICLQCIADKKLVRDRFGSVIDGHDKSWHDPFCVEDNGEFYYPVIRLNVSNKYNLENHKCIKCNHVFGAEFNGKLIVYFEALQWGEWVVWNIYCDHCLTKYMPSKLKWVTQWYAEDNYCKVYLFSNLTAIKNRFDR